MINNRFGDFYGGALHPLTALEHALPSACSPGSRASAPLAGWCWRFHWLCYSAQCSPS
jgi:hypothetical protein